MQQLWQITKTEAVGRRGAVAAKHRLASLAGLEMIERGGNAVDAAVAAAFAVGVVEPWMNGIGGGGLMLIYLAREQRVLAIDYAMKSALAARPDMFPLRSGGAGDDLFTWAPTRGDANVHGALSVAVPGTVAGLALALGRYGSGRISLAEAMAPAIRLAEDGFAVEFFTTMYIAQNAPAIAAYPETSATFLPGGFPATAAQGYEPNRIRQPRLAETLRRIAAAGPAEFYKGDTGRQIVEHVGRLGGILTMADLAAYSPIVHEQALQVPYGAHTVHCAPLPSGGPTVAQTIRTLDGLGLGKMGHNSAAALHAYAEAARQSFAARYRLLADPQVAGDVTRYLLGDEHVSACRSRIRPDGAMADPAVGLPEDGSTTHLTAADGEGNMVCLTQTLLSVFGSKVTDPSTGVLLNNGMMWFNPEPGHAASVRPGVRPLCNMAPVIVTRGGQATLAVGSSGGRKIIDANTQIALAHMDHGLSGQAAIAAPRIDLSTGRLQADDRLPEAVLAALRRLGHDLVPVREGFNPKWFASPTAISRDGDGSLHAGVDPFHIGLAVAL